MTTPEDRRFAEAAVRAGFISQEQANRVIGRLETMAGVNFAEFAIRSRVMTIDDVLEVGRQLKSAGHAAAAATALGAAPAAPAREPPSSRGTSRFAVDPRSDRPSLPPSKQPPLPSPDDGHTRPLKTLFKAQPDDMPLPVSSRAAHPPAPAVEHAPPAPAPAPAPAPVPAPAPGATPAAIARSNRRKAATRRIDLTEGGFSGFDIRPFLRAARSFGASDLHLSVGRAPYVRLHGHLSELDGPDLSADDTDSLVLELAGPERIVEIRARLQGEFLLKDEEGRRYRCCALRHRLGWDLAIRVIRETMPTVDELGIPRQLVRLTEYQQGLVLIAGPAGSGKSSTLAALLNEVNRSRSCHIITIEDPVEYVLEPDKCHVTQRELSRHTESYAKALRAALRESPDVIAIGELRDRETAAIAISAAETGHLVFATLHTGNATRTVASLVDMFPPGQRQQLLTMLSESIRGVICQQLVPGADRRSRHLALEVLLFTPGVAALVREDKSALLVTQMQTGRKIGMCRLDDSLEELLKAKKISPEEATARAEGKERFKAGGALTVAKLDEFFDVMLESQASDMIIAEGAPPKVRLAGRVLALEDDKLSRAEVERLLREICAPVRWEGFLASGDLDFAYEYGDAARFRANYYRHIGGLGAVFRLIPHRILSCEDLGVPAAVRELSRVHSGLVLITGPTGSGKSTTLAALVDRINSEERRHILTIEEPIEFVHPVKRSYIVQREVGTDVATFADALRVAGRFDCDVVLVGEMRDYETVSLALAAAERGLLVFGTLHTNSAAKTIDRIIDVFPSDEQEAVRKALTVVLKGVCSQLLCRRADGKGRIAVHEVLVQTAALSNIIREGATVKITSVIQGGRALGMQLMDDAIEALRAAGEITGNEAYMKSLEKTRFERFAQEDGLA